MHEYIEMEEISTDGDVTAPEDETDNAEKGKDKTASKERISKNWIGNVFLWIRGAGLCLFSLWQLGAIAYVVMDVLAAVLLRSWATADAQMYIDNSTDVASAHRQNINYFTKYCAIKFGQ